MKTKITLLVLLFTLNTFYLNAQIKQVKTTIPVYKTNKTYAKSSAKKPQKVKGILVAPNGKHYFFTNKRYFRYSKKEGLEKIANTKPNWAGIPDNIDGVFVNKKNKKAYFFKGSKYNRWDFKNGNDNPELAISRFWKGVPNNIDAVTNHPNGKIYFFKGDTYYRYDSKLKKVDKSALISKNWKGVPNDVAAALLHENGKIYFIKDNKYYRYNITSKKVEWDGIIGKDGWKGLDFDKKNFTKKIVKTSISNSPKIKNGTVKQVLRSEKASDSKISVKSEKKCPETDTGLKCTTQRRKLENAEIDHFLKKSNSVIEVPGNIINGNDLFTGAYKNINTEKNPYKIFIQTPNASSSSTPRSVEIKNPNSRSELSNAINTLKRNLPQRATTPKNAVLNVYKIESETDAKLKLGGSISSPIVKVNSIFNFNDNKKTSKYILEYTSVYYSIILDKNNNTYLTKDSEDIDPKWVYVDEVKYGKRFYFAIESNEILQKFESNTNIKGSYGAVKAEVDIQSLSKFEREELSIKQVVQGGNIISVSGKFPDNIINVLTKDKFSKANPGVPVSSILRFVKNNDVAQVSTTADYTERVCFRTSNVFKVSLENISNTLFDDPGLESEIYGWVVIWVEDVNGKKYKAIKTSGKINKDTFWGVHPDHAQDIPKNGKLPFNRFKTFKIPTEELQNATLFIKGRIKEKDNSSGDDNLGDHIFKVPLKNVIENVTVGGITGDKITGQRPKVAPKYTDGDQTFTISVGIEPIVPVDTKKCK